MINTSPEPVTNQIASILEDIAVFLSIWASVQHSYTLYCNPCSIFSYHHLAGTQIVVRDINRIFSFFVNLFGGKSSNPPGNRSSIT